jgi:hypothetical protein
MKVSLDLGVGVLLRNPRAELEVGAHRLAESLVVGQAGLVECLHVERDEPLPLLVGDLQVAVRLDQVIEAKLANEAVRP